VLVDLLSISISAGIFALVYGAIGLIGRI